LKSFASPPGGIPEVFAATIYLLAGFFNEIDVDKNKKPKDITWKSALKLMKNPDQFKEILIGFQAVVDRNEVIFIKLLNFYNY
jgi:dynein heavy chain